jgi:gas vesicle protein
MTSCGKWRLRVVELVDWQLVFLFSNVWFPFCQVGSGNAATGHPGRSRRLQCDRERIGHRGAPLVVRGAACSADPTRIRRDSMPSLIDRIRPAGRDLARDAARSIAQTGDAIADRTDELTSAVVSDAETVADRAADLTSELGERIAAAASDLEGTLRNAKAQVADGASLDDVVRRLERRWPGTDTGRYDRAFERGFARGRSGRLAVGAVVGAAVAGAGVYLFDPDRGSSRREALGARFRALADDARRFVDGQRQAMEARSVARDASLDEIVPVGVPVGPGRDVSVPEDVRTPVAAGSIAAGSEAERGDWHRDLEP